VIQDFKIFSYPTKADVEELKLSSFSFKKLETIIIT
jgi:hypothetical protein